jgi:flagellar biosynthesis/type III secretory pathway protein FliH
MIYYKQNSYLNNYLKINKFNNLAKDTLDEWIYYFKTNTVKPGSVAKGLSLVQKKLEFESLSEVDRQIYVKEIENQVIERDVWETTTEEALEKAEEKGMEKGMEKANRQGILRALQRGKLTDEEISEDFSVSLSDVHQVRQTLNP